MQVWNCGKSIILDLGHFEMCHFKNNLVVLFLKEKFRCGRYNYTDLGSLIGNYLCGNLRTFLPLWFYVKSIMVILKPLKLPIWPFRQLLILYFCSLLIFQAWNFSKNTTLVAAQMVKMAVLDASKWPKLISRKIRAPGKLPNYHTVKITQLGCPGL